MLNWNPRKIAVFRVSAELSQAELAQRMDVNTTTICRWETGVSLPSIAKTLALAHELGRDINDFLDATED